MRLTEDEKYALTALSYYAIVAALIIWVGLVW